MYGQGDSWDLYLVDPGAGVVGKSSLQLGLPQYSLTHANPILQPTATTIMCTFNWFYVGGHIMEGNDQVGVIATMKDDLSMQGTNIIRR